jgi:prepilin-type N-terminal cleavage/methylation domain-containing protein
MKNNNKGFTLIELLVVISIVSLLSSIFYTVLVGNTAKAQVAVVKQTASSVMHTIIADSQEEGAVIQGPSTSTGGGPICTNCSSTETWPYITSTGYTYSSVTHPAIGEYSFSIIKGDNPTIVVAINNSSASVTEVAGGSGTTPTTYTLRGTGPGGGIVFSVSSDGFHGLEVAPNDQSSGAVWGCSGIAYGTATAIGTGYQNTLNVISGCSTPDIAVKIAHSYNGGGFNNWYLPSKDELNKIYINLRSGTDENNTTYTPLGNFGDHVYWSSSEAYNAPPGFNASPEDDSWDQIFWNGGSGYPGGGQSPDSKSGNDYVRAIRSF